MHENTWGRVTLLIYLMFNRLDKFDGLIFEGLYIGVMYNREAYIRAGGGGGYQRDFTVFILCQWTYTRQITFHSYRWYNHVYLTRQVSYLCINISLLDDKFLVAVLFKTKNKFKNYFRVKDLVPETLRSNRFYKF